MFGKNHPLYAGREAAGHALAACLQEFRNNPRCLVLAIPRGGVPVAAVVARTLNLPWDIFMVRKLGIPWEPEVAMGAIASGGVCVLNDDVLRDAGVEDQTLAQVTAAETEELHRREQVYRGNRPHPDLKGLTVLIIDDGLATGATMRAAVQAILKLGAALCIPASPVGSLEACRLLELVAGRMVCPVIPRPFEGVGRYYTDFTQLTDEDVRHALGLDP